ncbi:MAG: BrnA antitoxin family protein [Candidatus Binatia bacterium]
MKKRSSSRTSKTDWPSVRAMKEHEIKLSPEHPELDVEHMTRVIVRRGLKPAPPKSAVLLRVDAEVLAWFKAQGPGYQTRINAVLRAFKEASL